MDNQIPNQISVPSQPAPLPAAGEILRQSWEIYKQRFWTLLGISAVPAVFMALGALILGGAGAYMKHSKISLPAHPSALTVVMFVAIVAVFIIIAIWSQAAALWNLNNTGQNSGIKISFMESKNKIAALFVTGLLSGLAIMGGFLLLIVPGIIFALWFSQAPYIVMSENITGTSALKQSKKYVKGRLGAVFGRLVIIWLVVFGISLAAGIIDRIIFKQMGGIFNNLISFIVGPLIMAYCYTLYFHLKNTTAK